jgi:hypothetical protein
VSGTSLNDRCAFGARRDLHISATLIHVDLITGCAPGSRPATTGREGGSLTFDF